MVEYTKAQLMSSEPIDFHGLLIYKPTLKEISEIGFANYNRYTAQLTLSIFDIAKRIYDWQPDETVWE